MKLLLIVLVWCVLFVLCPFVAIAALVLYPVVWLLVLPIRLVVVCVEAAFALLRAVLFLPARLVSGARAV